MDYRALSKKLTAITTGLFFGAEMTALTGIAFFTLFSSTVVAQTMPKTTRVLPGFAQDFLEKPFPTSVKNTEKASKPSLEKTSEKTFDKTSDMTAKNIFSVEGKQKGFPMRQLSFGYVSAQLTPYLEDSFDVFFFVNTEVDKILGQSKDQFVQAQHMKVIVKKQLNQPLFIRDYKNQIIGLTENAEIWPIIPVTTGPGRPYIYTFSGIFRFNFDRSQRMMQADPSRTKPSAEMSYSTYIDYVYDNGRESGVALHGDPDEQSLGKKQDSWGCVQMSFQNAKKVHQFLMSPEMWSKNLPEFNRRSTFPQLREFGGQVITKPGIRALLITFEGYK